MAEQLKGCTEMCGPSVFAKNIVALMEARKVYLEGGIPMIDTIRNWFHEVRNWFALLPVRMYIRKLMRSDPDISDKEVMEKVLEHFNMGD